MKQSSALLTIALAAALSTPVAGDVHAGFGSVSRCKAADGSTVYTDQVCGVLGARPTAMPGDLARRVAAEQARAMPSLDIDDDAVAFGPGLSSSGMTAQGRRSLASGCARSPTQLAMDLQGALALHDVNRVAESYHWVGMRHGDAMPVMQQLDQLSRMQVIGARYFDTSMGMGLQFASAGDTAPDSGSAGTLQLGFAGDAGSRTVELNVERYAGCYFVRF